MLPKVEIDLTWSQQAFIDLVWPCIKDLLGGGQLKSVELYTEKGFAKELDTLAGVDAWQIVNEYGIRPLAQRTQKIKDGYRPYNTFSIREKRQSGAITELEKLTRAIITESNRGFLHPAITCQAYVDYGLTRVLSAGLVKTRDLIYFVYFYPHLCEHKAHDNPFLYISWQTLQKYNVQVQIYEEQGSLF